MDADWIEHRRSDDGELLGWMKPAGEDFVAIDLLGRSRTEAVDWLTAEETLDTLGLTYLADPYELRLDDGSWLRQRPAAAYSLQPLASKWLRTQAGVRAQRWSIRTGELGLAVDESAPTATRLRDLERVEQVPAHGPRLEPQRLR